LGRVTSLPMAGDEVFGATRGVYERLQVVKELLADPETASVRLVVNPERMVIAEARRTATYLALFGYGVDAVVANRVLPDAIADPWFDRWKEAQAGHMATIHEGFAPVPVLTVELAPEEPLGVEGLRRFAAELYGDTDAAAVHHRGETMRVETVDGAHCLVLVLPFGERGEVDLARREDELMISVGPYRRAVVLPDSLRRRDVVAARLREGELVVEFS
jgi:arsenite/tail-anchored protein-transporting ATPase